MAVQEMPIEEVSHGRRAHFEGLTLRSGILAGKEDGGAPPPASRLDRAAIADSAAAF